MSLLKVLIICFSAMKCMMMSFSLPRGCEYHKGQTDLETWLTGDRHGQTVEMKQLSTRIGRLRACGDNGGKAARTFLRGHIYDHTIEIIDPH